MNVFIQMRNMLLAALAGTLYLFHRRASVVPQKILVIQNAKMGDMVCTTPMFRAIKMRYPSSHLVVMGSVLNRELLSGNPHVDEYVLRPTGFFSLVQTLSRGGYDAAILPGPDGDALLASLCALIPKIVVPRIENGWSPYETRTYRLLSRLVFTKPHRMGAYAPREYLRLLEELDIQTDDTRKEIFVSERARLRVRELLATSDSAGKKLIGIAPGVGNKVKAWGGERFAEVARSLSEREGIRIVIIGGAGDKEEVEKMLALLPGSVSSADFSGKLSLEELKALIAELSLFISVDTGPIYIAEALGIPTIDIVGPMDEREQPPRGDKHVVVVPERSEPMLHIMNAAVYDPVEARRQVEAVLPKEVVREADKLLDRA